MPLRNVTITDNEDQFIQSIIETGQFGDANEVFRAGLSLLEREMHENTIDQETMKKIEKGIEDIEEGNRRDAILKEAAGMWKNRNDLPDYSDLRRSWDRD